MRASPTGAQLCGKQGPYGPPARTHLPIGRGWPRLEAALSLIWHELAKASGRLCSTQVGYLSGDVRGLEREQVVQQRAPVGERGVLPLHRAEQQVVVVVRQLVRARARVGRGLDLLGLGVRYELGLELGLDLP